MVEGDQWLSYREAATALGLNPNAVAARARRGHWSKRLRNDGIAEILVPALLLESPPAPAPGHGRHAPAGMPTSPETAEAILVTLQSALAELNRALEREVAARQALQAQVDGLRNELSSARVANAVAQQQMSAERERRERAIRQLAPLERKVAEFEARQKQRGFWARMFDR